jgi:hypothetical protein
VADWSRIVNTTIKEYVRGEEVNVIRNRKVLAMLRQRGRITFNHAGDGLDWKIRYKRAPLIGYADTDTLTFSRRDRWKTAQLDWRGYSIQDSMTKMERLKNKSVEAIVKIYDDIARNLMDDVDDQFGDELYINGYAAGNQKRIHGFESMMGANAVVAGNYIVTPTGTYANLNTDLGNYGGTWSGPGVGAATYSWPVGTGDAHFDFWSPLLINYTDPSAWSAATKTWANTAVEALRYGIVHARKNKTKKGELDFIILNDEMFRLFLMILDTKERIVIDRGKKSGGLQTLGFDDIVNFDGVEVTFEYGTPPNTGYGWNADQMELKSLQGTLFAPEGPDYDIASKSWRFAVDFFGNICFNPRYFCKWKNYS